MTSKEKVRRIHPEAGYQNQRIFKYVGGFFVMGEMTRRFDRENSAWAEAWRLMERERIAAKRRAAQPAPEPTAVSPEQEKP